MERVAQTPQNTVQDGGVPSGGLEMALMTFAETLLERPQRGLKEWEAGVDLDCQSLVALLCDWPTGQPAPGWRRKAAGMAFVASSHPHRHLGAAAGPRSSVVLYSNDLNLSVDKHIVSSKISNPFPAAW